MKLYIFGNLVLGGLIGWLIVDPLTGAMWSFDSEKVSVTLVQAKPVADSAASSAPTAPVQSEAAPAVK